MATPTGARHRGVCSTQATRQSRPALLDTRALHLAGPPKNAGKRDRRHSHAALCLAYWIIAVRDEVYQRSNKSPDKS